MEQITYKVYALINGEGKITDINSSAFLRDVEGWMPIDEGVGDRYHHAQGNYLDDGIYTDAGIPRYRWDDAGVVLRGAEELAEDRAALPQPPIAPTNLELMDAILELAALIVGGVS